MTSLMDIHSIVQEELRKRYVLEPVKLKHPFPERPVRALGSHEHKRRGIQHGQTAAYRFHQAGPDGLFFRALHVHPAAGGA